MSNQKAVEWITRPCQVEGYTEPGSRGRLVEQPARVIRQISYPRSRPQVDALSFEQKLDLKETGW
jgi:hypothetical protein